MHRFHRFCAAAVTGASLFGCGAFEDSKCKCGYTPEPVVLCDGSDLLRFAATTGGGNLGGVPRVASEVGWSFLLVDGQCNYWSMTEPDGPIRTGTLDASEEEAFKAELELGRWTETVVSGGCADAGETRLRFLDDEMRVSCASNEVTRGYDDWLDELYARGTPASGDARYSVADASNDGWVVGNQTNIAAEWPLATDPDGLAVEGYEDERAEPHVASAADAESLRAVRDAYAARGETSGPLLRVPVVAESAGAAPRYYDLALRDVTPYEVNGRLDPDAFF